MAIVQSLTKTLETVSLINENRDNEAVASLGLKAKSKFAGSFLERVAQVASTLSENRIHTGGLMVTPDSKSINTKNIVNENMNISYVLTESMSMIAANSISMISTLSEDVAGTNAILNSDQMNNIKTTLLEGCDTSKDALIKVFANSTDLAKNAKRTFSKILGESSVYNDLMTNALLGANLLYTVNKVNSYTDENAHAISEAMNVSDMVNRCDDVLFGTLDLQENLIKTYMDMYTFDKNISNMLNENNSNVLSDVSDYISMSIEKVAKPLAYKQVTLKSDVLAEAANVAIESIVSLYDQYAQDLAM